MSTPFVVSYSSIRSFQTCPRKYYWEYVRRLRPVTVSRAQEFGSAWHLALSAWFQTGSVEAAVVAFNAAYQDSAEEALRTQSLGKRLLQQYADRYPREGLVVVGDERWLEVPMGDGVRYVMKIDKIITHQDETLPWDHKTTGGYQGITAAYLKQFKPNLQLRGYVYGVREVLGIPATKLLVDITWVGRGQPKSGEPFLRYTETVESWELEEFAQMVPVVAGQIQQRGDTFEAFTPNWSACTQYGECPFRRLCMVAPSIREREIREGYEPKPPYQEPVDDAV